MKTQDELGGEFLQGRLTLFGRTGFLFLTGFLLAFNVVNFMNPDRSWADWFGNPSNQLHWAAAAVLATLWLSCRGAPRSERFLKTADAVSFCLAGLGFTFSVWVADPQGNRNYAMLLELTNAMLIRSVIVPSSGRRTLWISASLLGPATHAAYLFDARRGLPGSDVLRHTAEAAVFCAIGVAVATVTSTVIYGLRRKVQEAKTVGQYTLEYKLGEGAMGVVYRASHAMLRRPTAVKLLPAEKSSQSSRRRFELEVQLTSQLTHPNTVAIYDYGRTPEGTFYYAMEYLEGTNLDGLVRGFGPQPPARVVHILRQICGSLAEAHEMGLVHRDIKPANVILCRRWGTADVVKVVDFGLVRELEARSDGTGEQLLVGTPLYMSPEAISSPDRVGPASDLYAVGAVGYYLLAGRNCFAGATVVEVLTHHLMTPPPPPSRVASQPIPSDLEALILSCLAKDVAARPASARQLRDALGSCADAEAWTEVEARAWWAQSGSARPAGEPPADIASQATLLLPLKVDLAGRKLTTATTRGEEV